MSLYCRYYQARLAQGKSHHLVAIIKCFDHLCFDRTVDVPRNIFEFFVPPSGEEEFLSVMGHLADQGIVLELNCLPNRLLPSGEQVEGGNNSAA